ncbi:cis-3-hydroxy-L-proline dehydratase [Chelativorans sp. YIM 93263]|uniref:cis-3-hydroxy-L-proline dehydratase n=1 Tax=Chelativorans sp. YIM 93263 TaxID=2906648 RepID=UPI00237A03E5|nr:aconitase X [Chelativorans sp. YIM 93263]
MERVSRGKSLVEGESEGDLLCAEVGLSFWGGVDPATGIIIDRHHPLHGECLAGRVLAIPSGRGSCSGSGVLLELILNGHAPAAVVVCEREQILTLGALVAELVFDRSIPVLQVERKVFAHIGAFRHARVGKDSLQLFGEPPHDGWKAASGRPVRDENTTVRLDAEDQALLSGQHGTAAQFAMRLLLRMAALQEAESFIGVSQVHIDGCVYTGPASLRFAQWLVGRQARLRVPTTLNSISVDKRRWHAQGVGEDFAVPATQLADAYLAMGAQPSFTCAPYLLASAPGFAEQVGWAESNAVVYANSVIGARSMKYPDYLDICIALTGRAPMAGCHLDAGRRATLVLEAEMPEGVDDIFWPLLGYCCGSVCGSEIPLIRGLETSEAGPDELKAFGAAFATVAAAPMFHIAGITPEADGQEAERRLCVDLEELRRAWRDLNTATSPEVELVALGNPHFSLNECARLATLVRGRTKSPDVAVVVTCGRAIYEAAVQAGHVEVAEAFGVQFVTDTCWCMLDEPVVPGTVKTLMTNSGKYAHYAPGLIGRGVRIGSLLACVEAACSGKSPEQPPAWLC